MLQGVVAEEGSPTIQVLYDFVVVLFSCVFLFVCLFVFVLFFLCGCCFDHAKQGGFWLFSHL